jgi:membrane associated rhomboid family serine protease
MRNFWRELNTFLARIMTPAVRGIFLANVIVFLVFVVFTMPLSVTMQRLYLLLAETPADAVGHLFLWQFVTYMFLHAGVGHLLMNMLMLWFFAPRLERRWGSPAFVRFYLIVGAGAGVFHALVAYAAAGGANVLNPMLGASGAIYGILLAYALYYPNDMMLLYFVIPIRVKYLVIVAIVITLFASFQSAMVPGGGADHISHITHLGGLLVAFAYLKIADWRRRGPRRVDTRRHPDFGP